MLRAWQAQCLTQAIKSYQHQPQFLVLASPGAGKTRLAAYIAKTLLDNNDIDYVVCFSPSRVVSQSIEETFESVLKRKFNGRLGSIGTSRTYHSLSNAAELINDLAATRVLVIFDEIHHCAGDGESPTNSWGLQLLSTIQHLATYTLSLTGTPWRTDTLPISFAKYSDPEGNIICDFSYDLVNAIKDKVCRMPQITAIDIEKVTVKGLGKSGTYTSLQTLLNEGEVSYQTVIRHPEVIKHLLSLSVHRLNILRKSSPNAGGLIVASSYEHALQIQSILLDHFNKESTLVSCRHDDSPELINRFRKDNSEWIISIAMISEGTDIPRLQVCCSLTDVTTELYFRQILGRIIRMTKDQSDIANMYMLAEPNLVAFAERLNKAIPGTYNYQKTEELLNSIEDTPSSTSNGNQGPYTDGTIQPETDLDEFISDNHDLLKLTGLNELTMHSFKSKIISYYL
ncbi:DEAD/DEAH box helicase [Marinomonas flavescens]|uniref:DEAD/DEAH box helicase n=1 Tax=Marinomonas flavescens TaxID=2529379 RepID=UPI00105438AC|nr:DEAD/DEAH box helicase family protein [Marinomonas flavescens]